MEEETNIVLYPSAGRCHLTSMVELAKLILTHHPSFSLTVIISTAPYETGSTAPYLAAVSAAAPSITFHHLPTISFPVDSSSSRAYSPSTYFRFSRANNPNFHHALLKLSQSSKPIKALVIDFYCSPAFEVGESLNIPTYYFAPGGATSLAALLYLPTIDRTIPDSLKNLNIFIDIPGLPPVPAKDMPTSMLDHTTEAYRWFLDEAKQMTKSAGIIRNTFEMLETRAVKAISEGKCVPDGPTAPPLYCIGPLVTATTNHGGSEEGHECLSWLDSQPSQSVLYLCFGSLGLFSSKQLKEIATGLERSDVRFLWVVRDPPPHDEIWSKLSSSGSSPPAPPAPSNLSLESILPEGFLERTKERGFVLKYWAPQVAVLNHDSVGGYVTQCGFNSVLEAVCAGVPMLAWPRYAEQKLNGVLVVEELKLALPMAKTADGSVTADELEKRVSELMFSDEGKAIKERVMAMRNGAMAAVSDGGSSCVALAKLAEAFKLGSQS